MRSVLRGSRFHRSTGGFFPSGFLCPGGGLSLGALTLGGGALGAGAGDLLLLLLLRLLHGLVEPAPTGALLHAVHDAQHEEEQHETHAEPAPDAEGDESFVRP